MAQGAASSEEPPVLLQAFPFSPSFVLHQGTPGTVQQPTWLTALWLSTESHMDPSLEKVTLRLDRPRRNLARVFLAGAGSLSITHPGTATLQLHCHPRDHPAPHNGQGHGKALSHPEEETCKTDTDKLGFLRVHCITYTGTSTVTSLHSKHTEHWGVKASAGRPPE